MMQPQPGLAITELAATDITTFTSAVVATSRHFNSTRPWWRGHRSAEWTLTPSLYRLNLANKEVNLNARFRLMARSRRATVPGNTDPFGWLFLMQHYRLPTRLLDWSQSPLIALYFAVELPDDNDAMLWALAPSRLNMLEANTASICMPGSKMIGKLGLQAFRREQTEQADTRAIAVLTEEADLRHMVQQSSFSVHGRQGPLEERPESHTFLAKIRIPRSAKEGFRQLLSIYGITRASLFPDLENLALELQGLDFEEQSGVAELANEPPLAF